MRHVACNVQRGGLSRVFQPNDVLQLLHVALKSKRMRRGAYDAAATEAATRRGEVFGKRQVASGRRRVLTACS